jgi:hypothetical protein
MLFSACGKRQRQRKRKNRRLELPLGQKPEIIVADEGPGTQNVRNRPPVGDGRVVSGTHGRPKRQVNFHSMGCLLVSVCLFVCLCLGSLVFFFSYPCLGTAGYGSAIVACLRCPTYIFIAKTRSSWRVLSPAFFFECYLCLLISLSRSCSHLLRTFHLFLRP